MPRSINSVNNPALLEAALAGLELQKTRVEEHIVEVRRLLGDGSKRDQTPVKRAAVPAAPQSKRKPLSAAARKRIAAAQKRRWAAYRKQTEGKGAAKSATKKARKQAA